MIFIKREQGVEECICKPDIVEKNEEDSFKADIMKLNLWNIFTEGSEAKIESPCQFVKPSLADFLKLDFQRMNRKPVVRKNPQFDSQQVNIKVEKNPLECGLPKIKLRSGDISDISMTPTHKKTIKKERL